MRIFDFFRRRKPVPAPWEKYYSDDEKKIKIPNITMYEQVIKSAKKYPKLRAINYMNNNISYEKLRKFIDKAAASFVKLGVKEGDIITICLPNLPNALIALYGLNKIGAIANMVHPLSAEEEIKTALISTKSKYIITLDLFYDKTFNIINETNVKKIIVASACDYLSFPLNFGYKIKQLFNKNKVKIKYDDFTISYKKFMKLGVNQVVSLTKKYGKNTPAVILHSGGTSGTPKNIVLQNRAFVLGSIQEKKCLKLTNNDSCLAIMPNFHGFGLSVCMHTPLVIGGCTTLVPQFNGKKLDLLIKKKKPTIILGVPTLYEAVVKYQNDKKYDLSYLRYVISGGDMLSKKLEDAVNEYLKEHNSSARITQGYGLSEALAAVILGYGDIYKSGSIGIPFPGNYVKIIDNATRETLPYGEVGEIVINSKALMMGYLNDESETNTALQIHKDGHIWLHTGDLGYMDEDGFIFCKGRLKRMIITSGYNVYPSHIEEVIETHPAVLQCSVVGIPHPYKQEVPKAFIVLNNGYYSLTSKNDIKKFCEKNLAKYMVPKEFVFRKKLPKTKLGKVDFKVLQKDFNGDDE